MPWLASIFGYLFLFDYNLCMARGVVIHLLSRDQCPMVIGVVGIGNQSRD